MRYLLAGSMRVFIHPDEARVLPIPYWTEGEPGRRFRNLKKRPALAGLVKELRGCAELLDFARHVNGARSRFATLGCDHWTKPVDHGRGVSHEAALYVDLVFDRLEDAARRRSYVEFVTRLKEHCTRGVARKGGTVRRAATRRDVSVIRIQPQRVFFSKLGGEPVWMISVWVFGAGSSESVAVARRRRGLEAVRAVCDATSREMGPGAGGTPIPP